MGHSRTVATTLRVHEVFLAAAEGEENINVAPGPVVSGSTSDWVHVGYDGDPTGDFDSASGPSKWAGIGKQTRNQEITVTCCIVVSTGNDDIPGAWQRVDEILGWCEGTLRADPSMAQTPTPFVAELVEGQLYTEPGPQGLQVRLPFFVHVKTRT